MKRTEAVGLVEVLGAASATVIVDKMLKTSSVRFEAWRSECGGQVTVFLSGDVSAVKAAVEAARQEAPCEIINTGVISRPSEEIIRLIGEAQKKFAKQIGKDPAIFAE